MKKRLLKKLEKIKYYFKDFFHTEEVFIHQSSKLNEIFHPDVMYYLSFALSVTLFLLILWASFVKVDQVITAHGDITPEDNLVLVKHYDGGVVKRIYHHEGEVIKKSEILAQLDGTGIKEELEKAKINRTALRIKAERLRSIQQHRYPNFSPITNDNAKNQQHHDFFNSIILTKHHDKKIIEQQLSQHKETLHSYEAKLKNYENEYQIANKILDMYLELAKNGDSSKARMLDEKRKIIVLKRNLDNTQHQLDITKALVNEYAARLRSFDTSFLKDTHTQLEDIDNKIEENKQLIQQLSQKYFRSNVRSPIDGIIKSSHLNAHGDVIKPGTVLYEVVPTHSKLIAATQVSPKDIGHIHVGQPVNLKISAFDYTTYGGTTGKVSRISASSFQGENKLPHFKVFITLEKNFLQTRNKKMYFMPGMQVDASIITGHHTIMGYLLKPIFRAFNNGLQER